MSGGVVSDSPVPEAAEPPFYNLEQYVDYGSYRQVRGLVVEVSETQVILRGTADQQHKNEAESAARLWLQSQGIRKEVVNLIGRTGG